jgi:hypothetical protein
VGGVLGSSVFFFFFLFSFLGRKGEGMQGLGEVLLYVVYEVDGMRVWV